MVTRTSHTTFWRSILLITIALILFSIWQLCALASELNVDILASKPWIGTLLLLIFTNIVFIFIWEVSFHSTIRGKIFSWTDRKFFTFFSSKAWVWIGFILFSLGLFSYSVISLLPDSKLFFSMLWIRMLGFWFFSLLGTIGFKLWQKEKSWMAAFTITILLQAALHHFISSLTIVTSYPFSLGWAETTRFYLASLFVSKSVYGQTLNWPIINPSLHMLLAPPYLVDAPLWFHRIWQVVLRYILLGVTALALTKRLSIRDRILRSVITLWTFLYLFQGPLYFHLSLIVIVVIWGYSPKHPTRTWLVIIAASIWAGLSRINWFPVPASLAAMFYLLETPYKRGHFWRYVLRPFVWIMVGTTVAFLTQRIYITASGAESSAFYTSLVSSLLWYRLWPNMTFTLGILPGTILVSLPLILILWIAQKRRPFGLNPLRVFFIGLGILVFFVTGAIISTKIGGGADLHNMGTYQLMLLLVTTHLVFGRYTPRTERKPVPISLPWSLSMAAIIIPVSFAVQIQGSFHPYNVTHTQQVISDLQRYVDNANNNNQDMLFISQRNLISFNELKNVPIIPEYEREELMEMAMANQKDYLNAFRSDMENQRFAFIVVDPLKFRLLGSNYFMGEENNVWVQRIMKHILCNYQEDSVYPDYQISVYVPKQGKRTCPQK